MRKLLLIMLATTQLALAHRVVYTTPLYSDAGNYQLSVTGSAYTLCVAEVELQNMDVTPQNATVSIVGISMASAFQSSGTTYSSVFNKGQLMSVHSDGGVKSGPVPSLNSPSDGRARYGWLFYTPISLPLPTGPSATAVGASNIPLTLVNTVMRASFKIDVDEPSGAVTGRSCVRCGLVNIPTPQGVTACEPILAGRPF